MWSKISKIYLGSIFGWTSAGTAVGTYDAYKGVGSVEDIVDNTLGAFVIGISQPLWIPLTPAFALGYLFSKKKIKN